MLSGAVVVRTSHPFFESEMAKEIGNNGFIKIHRSILEWQHWGEPNVATVFITLLLLANHKKGWWQGLRCGRGETFVTIDTLSNYTKLSRPTIIRILKVLEDSGEITRKKVDQKHTKTIIRKYNDYQENSVFSGKKALPQTLLQTLPQTLPKQERKERKENTSSSKEKESTHDEVLSWFINSQYLEQFAMSEGITPEFSRKLAEDIINEWKMVGKTHRSVTDSKQHLLNHIRKAVATMREKGTLTATVEKAKRLQPLIDGCKQLKEMGFKHEDVAEFYSYWTQPTTDGTGRMRFEKQDAWDTIKRFKTFYKIKKR